MTDVIMLPDWVCGVIAFVLPVVIFWMLGETTNEAVREAFEIVQRAMEAEKCEHREHTP